MSKRKSSHKEEMEDDHCEPPTKKRRLTANDGQKNKWLSNNAKPKNVSKKNSKTNTKSRTNSAVKSSYECNEQIISFIYCITHTEPKRNRMTKKDRDKVIAEFNKRDSQWMKKNESVIEMIAGERAHIRCNLCRQYPSIANKGMLKSTTMCGMAPNVASFINIQQ